MNQPQTPPTPEEAVKLLQARHDAMLEYFKASNNYANTVVHEDATVEDELKAEERFNRATQAAHRALTATATLSTAAPQPSGEVPEVEVPWYEADDHHDNFCVNIFAGLMKEKMAKGRIKGRGGWDDPNKCSVPYLQKLFHEHVQKGDPVDVANFCMMLYHYKASTKPSFDVWQENPYTKVLQKSIRDEYIPKSDTFSILESAALACDEENQNYPSAGVRRVADAIRNLKALASAPQPPASTVPKCGMCGATTVSACNESGCGFLESGNGEPANTPSTTSIGDDERFLTLFDDYAALVGREPMNAHARIEARSAVFAYIDSRPVAASAKDAEAAAEAVYNCLTGSKAHPWQAGGNSFKQDEARMYANAALAAIATTKATK